MNTADTEFEVTDGRIRAGVSGANSTTGITLQDELITVGVLDNENEVLNFLGVTNESIGMNSFDGDGNWTRIGIGGEFTPLGEDSASMSAVDLQNGAVSFIGLDSEVIVNSTANWQTNEYSVTTPKRVWYCEHSPRRRYRRIQ